MLVGPTGGGKTCCYRTLQASCHWHACCILLSASDLSSICLSRRLP
jgi:ABC-type lipopolysaccharide export system ATPase subunit